MYKNTNWIKRGAVAAVAAGLMLGALPGVAMANEVALAGQTPNLTKNWTVSNDVYVNNNVDFTFDLKFVDVKAINGNETALPKYTAEDQEQREMTKNETLDNKATITAKGDASKYKEGKFSDSKFLSEVFSGITFSAPGRYEFTITEDAATNNNVVNDTVTSRTVYVDVVWDETAGDGAVKIDGVYVAGSETVEGLEKKAEGAIFNNTSKDPKALYVEKQTTGTGHNKNDEFEFTITVNKVSGSYDVVTKGQISELVGVDAETNKATAKDGKIVITGKLSDDDSIEIKNLPSGATYSVTEKATDYTESYKLNNGNPVDGSKTETGKEFGITDGVISNENKVVFTNNKDWTPDTGITMNTLPFVGVAAVAAAGAVTLVISRKRRAGEEF